MAIITLWYKETRSGPRAPHGLGSQNLPAFNRSLHKVFINVPYNYVVCTSESNSLLKKVYTAD